MQENISDLSVRNLNEVQDINRELIEKALQMRCTSYLSQVKARLLTETIYEIDSSKKNLQQTTKELIKKQEIIARQKKELEQKNSELVAIQQNQKQLVSERTAQLEEKILELEESEERYSTLFTKSNAVMLLINPVSGQIIDANPQAVAYYGWSREELTAKSISQINILAGKNVSENMQLVNKNKENHFYFQHRLASGDIRDVEVYSSPINSHGLELLYSIIHDITDRRQAERALKMSEANSQALLNATSESAFLMDIDGTVITMNAVAAKRIGKSIKEVIGKCIYDLIPLDVAKSRKVMMDKVITTGMPIQLRDERNGMILDQNIHPIFDENGKVSRLAVFARDITKEKKTEKKLRESERFLALVLDSIKDGITVLTPGLRIIHTNKAIHSTHDQGKPLENRYCFEVYRGRRQKCTNCPAIRALQSGRLEREEVPFMLEEGTKGTWEVYAFPMFDDNGKITGVVECMRDITKRRQAEDALRESTLQQREAVSAANVGLWDWNLQTDKVQYSAEWKKQIGYELNEITDNLNEWESRIHPEDFQKVTDLIQQFLAENLAKFQAEFRFRHKNGSYRWILAKGSALKDNNGTPLRLIGSHLDITERVLAERKIKESLREKEVLLGEIHHRVKNNLAAIISLLNLQANQSSDPQIVTALNESSDRVKAMALIHETIYRSEDFAQVKLEDYISTLANRLLFAMKEKGARIQIKLNIGIVHLDLDQAIPFGLILNELLTNAFKYAFPEDKGLIEVTIRDLGPDCLELIVQDNGIGLPDNFEISQLESLGLKLVSNLVENQLEGAWNCETKDGAFFSVRWPRFSQ